MICIDNPRMDAYFNLAAEEYLLTRFSSDIFMLWQNEPSVIVGKHQDIRSEVNLDFIQENKIKVVRRFSGGGTVYHDSGNINLTFIESNRRPEFDKFTKQILELLSTIGIHAQADERRAIYIEGFKISGSAQYIRKDKVLYHATLLFSSNLTILKSTLDSQYRYPKNNPETRLWRSVKSVKSPVTNISEHLSYPLQIKEFKKIVINYFINSSKDNSLYEFNKEDIAAITKLKQEKYATTVWNCQT